MAVVRDEAINSELGNMVFSHGLAAECDGLLDVGH